MAISAAFGLCVLGTAQAQPVPNGNSTVHCDTMTKGVLKFVPALTTAGSGPVTIKVGGTLGGCSSASDPSLVFPEGKSKFKGVLNAPTSACAALAGVSATAGTLTFTWGVAAPGVTLKTSTVTVTGANGVSPIINGAIYGEFDLGASHGAPALAVSGAFTGGDGGATSGAQVVTQQSAMAILNFCSGPPAAPLGVKAINVGLSNIVLQ
jgi:hypothetical protein